MKTARIAACAALFGASTLMLAAAQDAAAFSGSLAGLNTKQREAVQQVLAA